MDIREPLTGRIGAFPPQTLYGLLERASYIAPRKVALVEDDHSFTWAEVKARVDSNTAVIADRGRTGVLGVWLDHGSAQAMSIMAASALGMPVVIAFQGLKPDEVAREFAEASVSWIVVDSWRASQLASAADESDWGIALVDQASGEWSVVRNPQFYEPAARLQRQTGRNDLACVLFTSGSSGAPKGVMVPHRTIIEGAEVVTSYLGITDDDTIVSVLPLSFDYGLNQLASTVFAAATIVFHRFLVAADLVDVLLSNRATGLAVVPTMWPTILAELERRGETELFLRYVTTAGGLHSLETLKRVNSSLPGVEVFVMYGLTESFRSTFLEPSQVLLREHCIGRPVPGVQILVLRDDGSECDVNEVGELHHRGVFINLGYLNNPDATAEKYVPMPGSIPGPLTEHIVRSGDLVRKDAAGYIYYVGRRDNQIKISGFRLSPEEVELVLLADPSISNAGVVYQGGRNAEPGQLIAFIEGTEGTIPDTSYLRRLCRARLPHYAVPSRFEVSTRLPRTGTGKIDYMQLRVLAAKEVANYD